MNTPSSPWPRRLLLGSLGLAALTAGFLHWRGWVIRNQDERAYRVAREHLRAGRPQEALARLDALRKSSSNGARSPRWNELEVEACGALHDPRRLARVFAEAPSALLADEAASLELVRFLHARDQDERARELRELWAGKAEEPWSWTLVEVDTRIRRGHQEEARELLEESSFPGEADAARLTRLAMMQAPENLEAAWGLLQQAYAVAPESAYVRSFRAQVLDALGLEPEAEREYAAALRAAPRNPLWGEQLANFYFSIGRYSHGLGVLERHPTARELPGVQLRARFWSRVVRPLTAPLPPTRTDRDEVPGLLGEILASLSPRCFFDEEALETLALTPARTRRHQELYWLRLLEKLRQEDEAGARQMLARESYGERSFAPALEMALAQVLELRFLGTLGPWSGPVTPSPEDPGHGSALYSWLRETSSRGLETRPREEQIEWIRFLKGPLAIPSVLLLGGWAEAGVRLLPPDPFVESAPAWVGYTLPKALHLVRGPGPALELARSLPRSPEGDLLQATLHLEAGNRERGEELLRELASRTPELRPRAHWELLRSLLREKRREEARDLLRESPELLRELDRRRKESRS